MSTASDPSLAADDLPPPDDPYRYGWRDVEYVWPDGSTFRGQMPLTRTETLHPQEEDHVVASDLHDDLCSYLKLLFSFRLRDDPAALVLSNTNIYWEHPEISHHGPDVAVIFDVPEPRDEWPSFDVAEQGTRPSIIIELVSPHVRKNDVVDKLEQYHTVGVPFYVIADRRRLGADWTLAAFRHAPLGFEPVPTDERGRVWLERLNLWLAAEGQRLVCYDGTTGAPLGNYEEVALGQEQALAQVAAAQAQATAAQAQATAAQAQATAARARADVEAAARIAAEDRNRALEAELARLRGQQPG